MFIDTYVTSSGLRYDDALPNPEMNFEQAADLADQDVWDQYGAVRAAEILRGWDLDAIATDNCRHVGYHGPLDAPPTS